MQATVVAGIGLLLGLGVATSNQNLQAGMAKGVCALR